MLDYFSLILRTRKYGQSPDQQGERYSYQYRLYGTLHTYDLLSHFVGSFMKCEGHRTEKTHTHVLPFLKLNWQLQVNPFNQLNRNNWWLNNFSMITLFKEMNRSCQTYMWTLIWFEAISAMIYVTYMKRSLSRWIHLFN